MLLNLSSNIMKSYFFGESFIGVFNLIDNPNIRIVKFKGATAKGLTKQKNENRKKISNIVESEKGGINCAVFGFGNVDVQMSFFYVNIVQKTPFAMSDIVTKYVEFIANLPNIKHKIILGVYPSPIKDENIVRSLMKYGVVSQKQIDEFPKDMLKQLIGSRKELITEFNNLLQKEAMKYGITYMDINDKLVDSSGVLKPKYGVHELSVHLSWEATIEFLIDKLSECGVEKRYLKDLKEEAKKYEEYKKNKYQRKKSL